MKISKQSFINQCHEIRRAVDYYLAEQNAVSEKIEKHFGYKDGSIFIWGMHMAVENMLTIPMEYLYSNTTDSWNTLPDFHETFLSRIMMCHVHHIIGEDESYEYMMDAANDYSDRRVAKYAANLRCDSDFYDLIAMYENGMIEEVEENVCHGGE